MVEILDNCLRSVDGKIRQRRRRGRAAEVTNVGSEERFLAEQCLGIAVLLDTERPVVRHEDVGCSPSRLEL